MTDPMTDPKPDPAMRPRSTGTSRAVRVVLVLSLALNLAVAGVVIGGAVNGRMPHHFGGFDMSLGPFERALTPEGRRAIREDLRGRIELRDRRVRGGREELMNFLSALRAEPFDGAAVAAIFETQRSRATSGMQAGHEALLARLGSMSPADRKAFADRLENELRRR